MPMNIAFELSDKDLKYFKRIIQEVRARSAGISEAKLIAAVREMIDDVRSANAAGFVVQRLGRGALRHAERGWEGWPGFYPMYGFVACVALVLVAKQLRKILMRDEDYYDR